MSDTRPWHEREDFWVTVGPAIFSSERLASTAAEIEGVLSLSGISPGASVLDMPCGVGRHSLELARRGYAATGVDLMEHYLDEARATSAREGLQVDWIHADMREFVRPGSFDLGLNLFSSIGYADDPEDDLRILQGFAESLRPGGRLVIELNGKELIARDFREREWHEVDGALWLEHRHVRPGWSAIESRWILVRGSDRREVELTIRLFSAVELQALLAQAGFAASETFGGLDGSAYDENARRLVVVASR